MLTIDKQVREYTLGFSNKIDRLIKDVALRFGDFSKINNQL